MEKSIVLANEISEICKLNDFIEDIGQEFNIAPDVLFNINLVLEEAVVNVYKESINYKAAYVL